MTIRTPYLVSHTKSTNLWFRRTIPVGWRQLAGRREIHFSLQTANKREAARRCRLASAVVQIIFDEAERWLERGAPEVNGVLEQVCHTDLKQESTPIEDAIFSSHEAHQGQMLQLLDSPQKMAAFMRIIFDMVQEGQR